jgi:hypothetical protein
MPAATTMMSRYVWPNCAAISGLKLGGTACDSNALITDSAWATGAAAPIITAS